MMKQLRHTYFLLLAAVTMVMAACSSDDATDTPAVTGGQASVTLRIATGSENAVTRAWQDTNAKTDKSEMMHQWVVILTKGGKIAKVFAGTPASGKEEIDDVCTDLKMDSGEYVVYSFANISTSSLATLLGVTIEKDATLMDATVAAATATINGNGFNKLTSEVGNGFGSYGIPMSNKQTLTVPASGTISKDLIVVRMLAKMELTITNSTGADVTVASLTLSDITPNTTDNLKLLPKYDTSSSNYNQDDKNAEDDMEAHHGVLRPNLGTVTPADFTMDINKTIANGGSETVPFYINESATPQNTRNLFYLTLKLGDKDYRYALVSDNANNEWNYIARNDYRKIPVVLDDYRLELIPYDFPPIGVYPVSVREIETDLYEMTFHDYGHFHLVPRVTKGSGISAVSVPFGSAEAPDPYWTDPVLTTAATKGGAKVDNNNPTIATYAPTGFYETSTETTDASENGGAPVFDHTTTWNGITGYYFGSIACPADAWWNDASRPALRVYHELTVTLHQSGTPAERQMLYRFYMTLSPDQMLYAPRRAVQPRRHH